MIRRDHALLTALFCAGLSLALFQCWYIYLSADEAGAIDWCRLTRTINCYDALWRYGASVLVWKIAVFPAIAGILFLQLALAGLAWTAAPARREAWIHLARLLSFPSCGLAVFALLHDYRVAKATSISLVLLTLVCLTVCILTVVKGNQGARLRPGAGGAATLAGAACLFALFLAGRGEARQEIESIQRERATAEPTLQWARIAPSLPRAGAVHLGDPSAPAEVLLFVESSSDPLLARAATLAPHYEGRVVIYLYATGEAGETLLAQRPEPATPDAIAALAARQDAALAKLQIKTFPAALWDGGLRVGTFDLRAVLEAASARATAPGR